MDDEPQIEIPEYEPGFLKPPEEKPEPPRGGTEGWMPDLNPTQLKIFNETARYVLAYGERGSGKGFSGLHSMVRHCYDNDNALAMACALSIRVGQEGILYDLETFILPAWRDGNRYPDFLNGKPHPKAGELMDNGIGLVYTDSKLDSSTKDVKIWIGNRHGGWSCILMVSMPYAQVIAARVKGTVPSFIYFDELGESSDDNYFKHFAAQLGRRRGMNNAPQQFYASCNPTGESSWLYKKYFVDSIDEKTGKRDPDFAVYHVPIAENIDRLPPDYVGRLYQAYTDPYERMRLIEGKWVDRPSGDAVFKAYFVMNIHVKGDQLKQIGILPFKGYPIITGFDPGPVNFCVSLMQRIKINSTGQFIWWVFDECNFVGKFIPYRKVVPSILKRFDYWDETVGTKFKYYHVADEASFNQIRPDGSLDCAEIEKWSNKRIKLRPCPKGAGSVAERTSLVINSLIAEEIFISATCFHTIQMFLHLVSKKQEPGKYDSSLELKPVRSRHLHPFDAISYPMLYFSVHPGRIPTDGENSEIVPQAYTAGRN